MRHLLPLFLPAVLLSGCGSRGSGGDARPDAPLVLAAGMSALPATPPAAAQWANAIDRSRLDLAGGEVIAHYDLTTPADEPFQFDVISRAPGNSGAALVALAHAADDGRVPAGDDSLAAAGVIPAAPGAFRNGAWVEAWGDGFSRVSLRGTVQREQVFAVRADNGNRRVAALVRLRIGPPSAINLAGRGGGNYVGVRDSRTLYSSNSWQFGLPTVAVSGDRTTVVLYEGDRADPRRHGRYQMRLQYDHVTHAVTGGGSNEPSADSGNWRDHEATALFNTLAVVRCGTESVGLHLSFDRGATFGQVLELDRAQGGTYSRLAQIAMAADYSLAVTFWRSGGSGTTDLMLVRGAPSAFDAGGSPTWYRMGAPEVVRSVRGDVTPLITGMAWSSGGDLVIGYGFTTFTVRPERTWSNRTENHCAVIPWQGELRSVLVDEEEIVGRDPSVATLGSGAGLRIFFAYESGSGVRLKVSDDAGRSFGPAIVVDDPTSAMPTVLARAQGGAQRVDLLWLAHGGQGQELHLRHWDDFTTGNSSDHRLTSASVVASASTPRGVPVPGAPVGWNVPNIGYRVTEVAWFGYDAVVDGNDVVVVLDEITYDASVFLLGMRSLAFTTGTVPPNTVAQFSPALPPPLAPGLTEPMPAPVPEHMHQLRFLRLD